MSRKAILVTSFGTSHLDTLEKTIAAIEEKARQAFPDRDIYRAFTSGMIRKKLAREYDICVDDVSEALDRIRRDGVRDVVVSPTHVIPGIENDNMEAQVRQHLAHFDRISVSAPLLYSDRDYRELPKAIMDELAPDKRETVVLMGHGSAHRANEAYTTLEYAFHKAGYDRVIIGTVESFPDLDNVLHKLSVAGDVTDVLLAPLMIVSGDHVKNDMAGDGKDAWKTRLQESGYTVRLSMKGLGEMEEVQNILLRHMAEVMAEG